MMASMKDKELCDRFPNFRNGFSLKKSSFHTITLSNNSVFFSLIPPTPKKKPPANQTLVDFEESLLN